MVKNPEEILTTARNAFNAGKTKSYEFRQAQLKGLLKFMEQNESKIVEILAKDNKKPKLEAYLGDINHVTNDIKNALENLSEWMAPTKPQKPLPFIMDQVLIKPEPFGVVLIIGAWNYPFALLLSPLIGAIAAGNCAIIKPSEIAPLAAKLMEEELPKYLCTSCYHVYNGGIPETTALLDQRFDYIFYTGNTTVGKIIYTAAAKNLTPVTLELGGKSPVYLDDSVDVEVAANRIMWGKCLNSGQSCIEPDYLLCSEFIRDKFIEAAKKSVKKWYGEKIKQNADYGRLINDNHFRRVAKLMEGQTVAMGGHIDPEERYIEPTILINVKPGDAIMQEEIFAPVLPILTVATPEEAIEFINKREKPLALYVFSTSKVVQDKFLNGTTSGGICINDVLMHYACDVLPFGGVGHSGIGRYHGSYTFETFSHQKATIIKKLDRFGEYVQSVRYPPYTEKKLKVLSSLSKRLPSIPGIKYLNATVLALFSIALTIANVLFLK